MPVIRKPVEPSSPAPGQPAQPVPESPAPKESAVAVPERAEPAPELTAALDNLAETLQSHMVRNHGIIQSLTVRGLEAVDVRAAARHQATDHALHTGLIDVSVGLQTLRAEIQDASAASRKQIDDLSGRVHTALEGILDVLRQMKSETVVLRDSIDALDLEIRMRKGEPGGRGPG